MSASNKEEIEITENKFLAAADAINNSERWTGNVSKKNLITGNNCFELHCNFADRMGEAKNLV